MATVLPVSQINSILRAVAPIIRDDNISVDITYRRFNSASSTAGFDPTTAILPSMYTESSVSAFKGGYTLDEVEKSNGLLEAGDVKFIVLNQDVTGVLSVDDEVFENLSGSTIQSSTTYQIKSINRDPLNLLSFLQARTM